MEDKILQLKQENMRLMRLLRTGAHSPAQSIDTGGRVDNLHGGGHNDQDIAPSAMSLGDGMAVDPLMFGGGGDSASDTQPTEPATAARAYQLRSRQAVNTNDFARGF